MTSAYVGLGANLGDPPAQLREAIRALSALPAITRVVESSFYRSAPLGPPGQPDYCNAVVQFETTLTAADLLECLFAIERAQGRERRGQRWLPRRIDLDLLLYGDVQMSTEGLTLPHPEMHRRNFVLVPLAEIAPAVQIPGHGRADECAARVGREGLQLL